MQESCRPISAFIRREVRLRDPPCAGEYSYLRGLGGAKENTLKRRMKRRKEAIEFSTSEVATSKGQKDGRGSKEGNDGKDSAKRSCLRKNDA